MGALQSDNEIKDAFISRRWKRQWKHWAKNRLRENEEYQVHSIIGIAMNLFTDRLKYECMHSGGTLNEMYDTKNQYNI